MFASILKLSSPVQPVAFAAILKFDVNQRRDKRGRWTTGGGAATSLASEKNTRDYKVDDVVASALGNDLSRMEEYHAAIERVSAMLEQGGYETAHLHTKNGDGTGGYSPSRRKLHRAIIDHYLGDRKFAKPAPGTPPTFTVLGGRGGSGKSNFDASGERPGEFSVYSKKKAVVIDPDAIRELLPEYDPQLAALTHAEAVHVADRIKSAAMKLGLNVVLDITMKTYHGDMIYKAKKAGYRTEAHFMHRTPEAALKGAVSRWNRETLILNPITKEARKFPRSRLVPPAVVEANVNNERNFDRMAKNVDSWTLVTNEADHGFKGRLVASGEKVKKEFAKILKANPYHDAKGRFASKDTAASASHKELKLAPADWKPEFKSEPHTPENLEFIQGVASSVTKEILAKYPVLADVDVELSRVRPKGGCHGNCTYAPNDLSVTSVVSLSDFSDDELLNAAEVEDRLQKSGMPRWSVNAADRMALDRTAVAAGTFRHEFGHVLARLAQAWAPKKMSVLQDSAWKAAEEKTRAAREDSTRKWIAKNVSAYALRNLHEFHAELFAQVSHPSYVKGTLPKQMEALAENIVHLAGRQATHLKKWAKKEEAMDKLALHINIDPPLSGVVKEVARLIKSGPQPKLPTVQPVRKGFATILKANPYHEPAGSPKGGQFTSKEKAQYRLGLGTGFASALNDLMYFTSGSASPSSVSFLKAQALANNLKAKAHGVPDIALAYDWKQHGHLDSTMAEVGIQLTEEQKKAMAHWAANSAAAGKKLSTMMDKEYPVHYAKLQEAIDKHGVDSAEVKKLMKVDLSYDMQAYKFGASPAMVASMHKDAEAAYKKAKEDALAQKTAELAGILTPAPVGTHSASTEVPKYQGSATEDGGLKMYDKLGTHYYRLQATLGQSHPDTAAAHHEWAQVKAEMSQKGWADADKLSKMAYDLKLKVTEELAKVKKDILAGVFTAHKDHALHGSGTAKSLGELYQAALKAGVPNHEIMDTISSAETWAKDLKAAQKNEAIAAIKSASLKLASASYEGTNTSNHAAAVAALLSAKTAGLAHLSKAELAAAEQEGVKQWETVKKALDSAAAKHGSSAATGSNPADGNFRLVALGGNSTGKTISYADFLDHAKTLTKGLSDGETSAIESYTGSGYKKINKSLGAAADALKSGAVPDIDDSAVFKKIKGLDSALAKSTLGHDTVVFRNLAGKWFWKDLGVDSSKVTSSPDFGGLP